ncbi:RidA family protein [Prauserella rugosa]|uniref:Enamine deaminase RidA (YjgF/YER057c/UK114 family) n=1 Tax=Prauserella rugosa TaxID=43354 RepID=A0A660CFD6_9PSEU|nr:Rid family hydrolase [Prauserella rugosa]KID28522.1 putative translation initiation inhibitor, yjgF family [Prauserella sp. Am3]KMS88779.1 endoribonuclease [Streptomyces regensis]TWH20413.1 enamine deaminase RidA (YjgF/YER057c/UK114 family) [Prauserella rugosa]
MTVQTFSPEGMFQPVPYHHVSVATGNRHIHVAGQIARDGDGNPVATGDLTSQVAHALRNTARGLAGAGASFDDVVRLRFFAVDWSPEKMEPLLAGIEKVAAELGIPQPWPPVSLIGVDYLFEPDVLVEVEAYAITD